MTVTGASAAPKVMSVDVTGGASKASVAAAPVKR